MAKANINEIPNLDTSWEGYAGSSVEALIKKEIRKNCGYINRSSERINGHHYLYGFHSIEEYEEWNDGSSTIQPLFTVELPELENSIFTGKLTTNIDYNKTLINLGQGIKIKLKYTSTLTNPISQEITDTGNSGTLIIYNSSNNSGFVEVGNLEIRSISHNNETEYSTEIDISKYLSTGNNKIRFRVQDSNGNISNTIIFSSIINTTLSLINQTPITTTLTDNAFKFYYQIYGNVGKTLNIKIKQNNNVKYQGTFDIGTNIYSERFFEAEIENHTCETGMIEVESWLTVNEDPTLESTHIINQFYYSNNISDDIAIILNNIITEVDNNSFIKFFDFVLYSNANVDIDVNIIIRDKNNINVQYLNYIENNCKPNNELYFSNKLEIHNNDNNIINAVVEIRTKLNNEELFPQNANESYDIIINNTEKLEPTTGAVFVLDPSLRNNNEINKNTIRNSATNGTQYDSKFYGFDFINDGWINVDDGKVLRIPAKHNVQIEYNPLSSIGNGTTIEIDFKTYNIFNDNEILFSISNIDDSNQPLGFIMNPTKAVFYTNILTHKDDQDVMFQEDVRTHLTINIIPNLDGKHINYIRIFINGIINREMIYTNDTFTKSGVKINIGGTESDIDIYGIRIYQKGLSSGEILNDYICTISDINKRQNLVEANKIIDQNEIHYDFVKGKYNTLIWFCSEFLKDQNGNTTDINIPCYRQKTINKDWSPGGTLIINKFKRDENGNFIKNVEGQLEIDNEHSGTIFNVRCKGQGTSSKTYWKWNQQYDWNKIIDPTDPTGKQTIKSTWIDLNGKPHTDGYTLTKDDPPATKLVAKLNWASSMQSHKIGSTALYNDLFKEIVVKSENYNGMLKDVCPNARVAVHEEPFLFFIKSEENQTPKFYGLMTFGSGKYDNLTFGYDKSIETIKNNFLMLEGSDNNRPLTLRQVPWIDEDITYDDEEYQYNGFANLDYGMGNIDKKTGAHNSLEKFKNAFNFTYEHSIRLKSYINDNELIDKTYQYWYAGEDIHDEDNNIILERGDIKRYDYISNTWVDAGLTKIKGYEYEEIKDENNKVIGISVTQLPKYSKFNIHDQIINIPFSGDAELDNKKFKEWRINDFRDYIGEYYDVNDVLFSMGFLKLIAATDNRCKNTYEYYDPIDKKIHMAQDDMDTIIHIDNVGRKNKPYYVEEHEFYGAENNYKPYFNGEDNNFFTLMDYAFTDNNGITNIPTIEKMLRTILTTMKTRDFGGGIDGCLQKYFYWIQEYFPARAYNETTKLLYEEAQTYYGNEYANDISPMVQSLGDQLEAEKEWFKKRLIFLKSLLKMDEFNENGISWRPYGDANSTFYLKPSICLYPSINSGVSTILGNKTLANEICNNGNGFEINLQATDQQVRINGSDYYISFGEFSKIIVGGTFSLSGKHLREFIADIDSITDISDNVKDKYNRYYKFRPTSISISETGCPNIETFSVHGCDSLGGAINFEHEKKLISVDFRGTQITSIIFPESGTLTTIKLPKTLTSLKLINCPNVSDIYFEDSENNNLECYSHFLTLIMDNIDNTNNDNPTKNFEIFDNILRYSNDLETINLQNVNIDFSNDIEQSNKLYNLLTTLNSSCEGHIILNKQLTFEEQNELIIKYGKINLETNKLYIEYNYIHSNDGKIIGSDTIAEGKKSTYTFNYNGNDIYEYIWQVNDENISITKKLEKPYEIDINVPKNYNGNILLSLVINRKNTTTLSFEKNIEIIPNTNITKIDIDIDNLNNNIVLDSNNRILCGIANNNEDILIPIKYLPEGYTSTIKMKVVEFNEINNNFYSHIEIPTNNPNDNMLKIRYTSFVGNEHLDVPIKMTITLDDDNSSPINKIFNIRLINPITKLYLDSSSNIIWEK